jgi:hypothetical protein
LWKPKPLKYNECAARITAGVLVRNYEIRRAITDRAMAARAKLMGLPSRIARVVIGQKDRDRLAEIVSEPINEAITELRLLEKDDFRSQLDVPPRDIQIS